MIVCRTRKRNLQGVLNDGMNSLSRFYLNNFRDSIFQLAIDYFLGLINLTEYTERMKEQSLGSSSGGSNGGSKDLLIVKESSSITAEEPASHSEEDMSLSRLHAAAIENCRILICRDDESFIKGWALPCTSTQIIPTAEVPSSWTGFKEDIFLLTGEACYSCRYHHYLERIIHYQRVPLDDIIAIEKGPMKVTDSQAAGGKLHGMIFRFKKAPKGRVDPGTFMNRRLSSPNLFSKREEDSNHKGDDNNNNSNKDDNISNNTGKEEDAKGKTIISRRKSDRNSALLRNQPIMEPKQFRCWVSPEPSVLDEIIASVIQVQHASGDIVQTRESIDWTPSQENISTVSKIQRNLRRLFTINGSHK